jgi:hypothetical protein
MATASQKCNALLQNGTPCRYNAKVEGYCRIHHKMHCAQVVHTDVVPFNQTCAICLDEMNGSEGGEFCVLSCKHAYHRNCLKEWLVRKKECPMCKAQVQNTTMRRVGAVPNEWQVSEEHIRRDFRRRQAEEIRYILAAMANMSMEDVRLQRPTRLRQRPQRFWDYFRVYVNHLFRSNRVAP